MGVRKYRSVTEMPGPPPRRPLDEENLRLVFELIELTQRLHPNQCSPGVRKFRSYDEAYLSGNRERNNPE
jgi:hypothetical protein